MEYFTPGSALLGGTLIGLSAAILWIGTGRVAGISGILGQLLPPGSDAPWRIAFLVSLVLGALGGAYATALATGSTTIAVPQMAADPLTLTIAGLLVGVGTRIGNGCTSGHGVCGLARYSVRSMAAVFTFFSIAMLTVALRGGV